MTIHGGIQHELPADAATMRRKRELQRLMMGIEENEEGLVLDRPSLGVRLGDGIAGQSQAEAADVALAPVLVGHLLAIRSEPGQVLDLRPTDLAPLEEETPMKDGVLLS